MLLTARGFLSAISYYNPEMPLVYFPGHSADCPARLSVQAEDGAGAQAPNQGSKRHPSSLDSLGARRVAGSPGSSSCSAASARSSFLMGDGAPTWPKRVAKFLAACSGSLGAPPRLACQWEVFMKGLVPAAAAP